MFIHFYKLLTKYCTSVPSPPQNLNLVGPDRTAGTFSVTVRWERPDPPNGRIINYNVSSIAYASIIIANFNCYRYPIMVLIYKMKCFIILLL